MMEWIAWLREKVPTTDILGQDIEISRWLEILEISCWVIMFPPLWPLWAAVVLVVLGLMGKFP